jgi:hypothetical protein
MHSSIQCTHYWEIFIKSINLSTTKLMPVVCLMSVIDPIFHFNSCLSYIQSLLGGDKTSWPVLTFWLHFRWKIIRRWWLRVSFELPNWVDRHLYRSPTQVSRIRRNINEPAMYDDRSSSRCISRTRIKASYCFLVQPRFITVEFCTGCCRISPLLDIKNLSIICLKFPINYQQSQRGFYSVLSLHYK